MDNKENLNQEQAGQSQGGNWLENTDNGGAPVPEFKGDRLKDSGTGYEGVSSAEEWTVPAGKMDTGTGGLVDMSPDTDEEAAKMLKEAEEKSNHASRANEANPWAGNNPSVMSETKTPDQK